MDHLLTRLLRSVSTRYAAAARRCGSRGAALLVLLACAGGALQASPAAQGAAARGAATKPVDVLAAASLAEVMTATAAAYERRSGVRVRQSFASSAQLARQLAAGARADILVTADQQWMDHVEAAGLLQTSTRRVLAGNRLVVIAPAGSAARLEPTSVGSWNAAIGNGRLVTGDPGSVPLGRYARAALWRLGVWDRLEPRLARAEDARAALALVARGEAALGIVYATDARATGKDAAPRVRVLATLDAALHPPVEYPAALTVSATATAAGYLEFLAGGEAREIFRRHGFTATAAAPATGARSASPRPD
jgi:molybdate transport system substrate-binding protein